MLVLKRGELMDKVFKVERDILFYAMRYAIGRQTFAPTVVIENIKHNIELFNSNDLQMLIRDIEGHIGSYGMECDERNWMGFKEYLKRQM